MAGITHFGPKTCNAGAIVFSSLGTAPLQEGLAGPRGIGAADGEDAGLGVVDGVREVQVHGGGDGGVGVAVLFHVQRQGDGGGDLGVGGRFPVKPGMTTLVDMTALVVTAFLVPGLPVKKEPEEEPEQGQGGKDYAHGGEGQDPAVGVALFHLVCAGGGFLAVV